MEGQAVVAQQVVQSEIAATNPNAAPAGSPVDLHRTAGNAFGDLKELQQHGFAKSRSQVLERGLHDPVRRVVHWNGAASHCRSSAEVEPIGPAACAQAPSV
jgi:hypothetical protein